MVDTRELDSAVDRAAVLGRRLDDIGYPRPGPLPWLPAIPQHLQAHEMWGSYLTARAATVRELASGSGPAQMLTSDRRGLGRVRASHHPHVIEQVEVWRAAMGVSPDDRRPPVKFTTQGSPDLAAPPRPGRWPTAWHPRGRSGDPWWQQLAPIMRGGQFRADSGRPLGRRLTCRGGRQTAAARGLCSKSRYLTIAAAALWWRICRHLNPAVSAQISDPASPTVPWESRLAELIGTDRAQLIQTSPWWPTLVTTVDHALQRGWRLDDLISAPDSGPTPTDVDHCQARRGASQYH